MSNIHDEEDDMTFDKSPLAENLTSIVSKTSNLAEESKKEENKEIPSVTLPHKCLRFEDFEIMDTLGEGSFGKVFKVKKKDTGKVYAMKSMSKKQLI